MRALALLLLAGCAPPAALRPVPGLAEGRAAELGAGAVAQSPRPYVTEPWRVSAQMWGSGELDRRLELSTVVTLDDQGAAAGVALRWVAVDTDRAALGVELQLGWAWIAVALPASVRLFGESRLYVAPRLGTFGARWTPALPLGLSLGLPGATFFRAEGQASWPGFDAAGRRIHLSVGAAQGLR